MTETPEDKTAARDLLEWLGFPTSADWSKARLLGGVFGVVLVMFFLAAFVAAASVIYGTIRDVFAADRSGPNLGAGALITALLGAPFLIWSTVIKHKALGFQKEGHLTDRISKAVEQLGAEKTVKVPKPDGTGSEERTLPNIEVRIGGILSLERIAQDSTAYDNGRDHVRCMEILCAYIRENAAASEASNHEFGEWKPLQANADREEESAQSEKFKDRFGSAIFLSKIYKWGKALPRPRADISLALQVIGRRDGTQRAVEARWGNEAKKDAIWIFAQEYPRYPEQQGGQTIAASEIDTYLKRLLERRSQLQAYKGYRLDLRETNLQGADLSHLVLSAAKFSRARLEGANLSRCQLRFADLDKTRLDGTMIIKGQLEGADLSGANLESACLRDAQMEGSFLVSAKLFGADLSGATLHGAALGHMDCSSLSREQQESTFSDGSVNLNGSYSFTQANWFDHWPKSRLSYVDFQAEWRKWLASPSTYTPPPP